MTKSIFALHFFNKTPSSAPKSFIFVAHFHSRVKVKKKLTDRDKKLTEQGKKLTDS